MGLYYLDHRQKRLLLYLCTAVLPLLVTFYAILFGFHPMLAFGVGVLLSFVGMFFIHRITTNALTRYEIEGEPLLLTIDSLGVINFYNVGVSPTDRIASVVIDNKKVGTVYSAANVFETFFRKESIKSFVEGETENFSIPKSDAYTHTFKARGAPTLIFNRRTNSFWTKAKLCGEEDAMILENNVAFLSYATKSFEQTTSLFAERAIDALWRKYMNQNVIWLVIAAVAIIVAVAFGGDIMNWVTSLLGGGNVPPAGVSPPVEATEPLVR